MSTGYLRVELFTADIKRTVEFYERVMSFATEKESPGYVGMRRGDILIGIGLSANLPDAHPIKPREGERLGLGVELVVEVDDIDAEYGAVEASGYPITSPIADRPWGLRDFRLVDPNGYYIRVTSSDWH